MGRYDDRPYDVGKGKPPRQHRWAKGVSGNPLGRKSKKKLVDPTLSRLVQEVFEETVPGSVIGRKEPVSKIELLAIQLVHDSLEGSPAQRISSAKMLKAMGVFDAMDDGAKAERDIPPDAVAAFVKQLAEEFEIEQEALKE